MSEDLWGDLLASPLKLDKRGGLLDAEPEWEVPNFRDH